MNPLLWEPCQFECPEWEGQVKGVFETRGEPAIENEAVRLAEDFFADSKFKHENGLNGNRSGPTLRDAALTTAIKRLATVILQRDIWP